jgi:hypothetical protein
MPANDPEWLRVYEIARGDDRGGIGIFSVDLPTGWARTHSRVEVALAHDDALGWHARLVGDDDEPLMAFPWHDHVDRLLLGAEAASELPLLLDTDSWDDIEQGWWAAAIRTDSSVYLAETDLDDLIDSSRAPQSITHRSPGVVTVDGVGVRWARVAPAAYSEAWKRAVERFQQTG